MKGFQDRREAGKQLVDALEAFRDQHPIILALPRGGVPVGYEVARALDAPLDVRVVRKLGVPWHPELGVGAVAEGGDVYVSEEILREVGLSDQALEQLIRRKQAEVTDRVRTFREGRRRLDVRGRMVILVDDGIATGGTVRAAIRAIREEGPASVVLAVPVAAADTVDALAPEVDDIVCLVSPSALYAIGLWYKDFLQVSDDDVVRLLEAARQEVEERKQECREAKTIRNS